MDPNPGRAIELEAVPNFRDVGGWPTTDGGTVRNGLVFRSTELSRLAGNDLATFERLGIRSVYDLRTASETDVKPDALPAGVELVLCDVLADHPTASAAHMADVLADPSRLAEMLDGLDAAEAMAGAYRDFVTLPSAVAAYGTVFGGLLVADRRPTLYHCTGGKDRTGWATAALLTLLGVSRDDVTREYLLTNDLLLPAIRPRLEAFAANGGDVALLESLMGVRTEYLDASFETLDEVHGGSIEAYFADGLGIDAAGQATLRHALVHRG